MVLMRWLNRWRPSAARICRSEEDAWFLLAKNLNGNAGILDKRVACALFASKN